MHCCVLVVLSFDSLTLVCSLEKQKNRALNTLGNLTFSGTLNGQLLDSSRISGTTDDLFTSKLKAELDRSINKHLEAGRLSTRYIAVNLVAPRTGVNVHC